MRTKKAEHLRRTVAQVVAEISRQQSSPKKRLTEGWDVLAGERAARHSRPTALRRGVISVRVDGSSWLYKMTMDKEALLQKIRREISPEIKDISFRIGTI